MPAIKEPPNTISHAARLPLTISNNSLNSNPARNVPLTATLAEMTGKTKKNTTLTNRESKVISN